MKLQQIKDIQSDYHRTFAQWKRAYISTKYGGGKRLGELEEKLELMYDDVGKALVAAVEYIKQKETTK